MYSGTFEDLILNRSDYINGDYQTRVAVTKLRKNEKNLVGISIGGGPPLCPCTYVVQILADGPAEHDKCIEPGDQIISINGISVDGKTKQEVAVMIQNSSEIVTIQYSKLIFEVEDIGGPDIFLKKIKHWLAEKISFETADILGISRAVLVKDQLLDRMKSVNKNMTLIQGLKNYLYILRSGISSLSDDYQALSRIMKKSASYKMVHDVRNGFDAAADIFLNYPQFCENIIDKINSVVKWIEEFTMNTKLDIKNSMNKYLKKKITYLSYCLKVKEYEDEMSQPSFISDFAYRMEFGNLEYRVALRCRHLAKSEFVDLRQHVLAKYELLDQKYVEESMKLLATISQLKIDFYSKLFENIPEDYFTNCPVLPEVEIEPNF